MSPRILMIEDDADAREVLQLAVEAGGQAVVVAADGVEGSRWRRPPVPTSC
jgi:CheY-like chemotaxis protein